ncbi:MAG: alginate export family protein [Planctomycetota bacterium]
MSVNLSCARRVCGSLAALALAVPSLAQDGAKPWRLQDQVGMPDWLKVSGSIRVRGEALDGEFRSSPTLDNSDQLLMTRSHLRIDATGERLGAAVELMDARVFGGGDGSFINTSIANPIDFLQAYATVELGALAGGEHRLLVGRETLDLGGRRLVARNRFRNTINAFDAVDWLWSSGNGTDLRVFWSLPVERQPSDRTGLLDGHPVLDEQDIDNQFYGAFLDTALSEDVGLELYAFQLDESAAPSRQRHLTTPGFRLTRKAASETIDFEVESAVQFGDSRQVGSGKVDHLAWFAHAAFGYTFDAVWKPRVQLAYDFASGDADPTDGDNGRFDTLFGARRWEFGPTGIYGAIARSNLSSPELRVVVKPTGSSDVMVAVRGVWLAEARDAWTAARVQDPTGAAGKHVGEQVEFRVRHHILPKSLLFEWGGAYLFAGRFQDDAPGGQGQDTAYGYAQAVWTF